MTAVLLRARAEMRARWKAWLSLTIMVGLFGGAVIGISAGARRTDTAYPRFLAWSRAWDVAVPHFPASPSEGGNVFASVDLDHVEALPQVVEATRIEIFDTRGPISANVPLDARALRSFDRPKVIEGRLPRPDAPDEIAMNWVRAQSLGIQVGDTVRIEFPLLHPSAEHPSERIALRVVGTEAQPGGFPPFLTDTPGALMSPAFARAHRSDLAGFRASLVRLQRGFDDIPAFVDDLHRLAHHKVLFIERQDSQAANVQRSFHLQAIALWLLAGLTGLVAVLVLGQTLARQTFLESGENPTLSSLGMTRSQLLALAFLRAGIVGVAGALLAVVVAITASPLFPTGLARVAEPYPGLHVDGAALASGALLIVGILMALSVLPAWRAAAASIREDARSGERPSRVAAALARLGLPLSGAAGTRMALERGRGRTAVPVGTAVAGVTVGIAALVAALTFGASLTNLLATPRLYGLTWDLQIGTDKSFPGLAVQQALERVARADPRVAAYGLGTSSLPMSIDGTPVDAVAMFHDRGAVRVPIVTGRAPGAGHEIALGPKTLDRLHKEVGDSVRVGIFGSRPKPMRVVGEAIIPPVGDVGRFGEGALVDYRATPYLVPGAPAADTLFVRTVPGADPRAVGDALARRIPEIQPYVQLPSKPNDLVNFGRVQNFPLFLAALVALLAAATLAHVLVTSIRRRRRDLAILKTLGFERGQITATVAWQATTLALLAALIGLPLGIAAGRWTWNAFANNLGIVPSPAIPFAAVLFAIPATLLLANLIAYLPGRTAGRVKAAAVLRTE